MKYLVAILALSALAYGEEAVKEAVKAEGGEAPEGVAVDVVGAIRHEHFKMPTIIQNLIDSLDKTEKEALQKVREEVMKSGQPMKKDEFMAELNKISPALGKKFEDAHINLEKTVEGISSGVKDLYEELKKVFMSGTKPSPSDIKDIIEKLQALPKDDAEKLYKELPSLKDLANGPHMKAAAGGKAEAGKKQDQRCVGYMRDLQRENAQKLEDEVKALPPAAQAVYESVGIHHYSHWRAYPRPYEKKVHGAEKKPSAADMQAFAKGLKELSEDDRNKYFELLCGAKYFYDGPHF
ncbi:hypothetical protein QR680_013830 [Steinernema hermaphroditum]|uniref:Fatty-acid and retinol-binding protein 1 n=1 Tax=Steinernema hermaphroditum TaxID=289476 RepID=A0AA39I9F5_9BILA|nr:hypothetical protein QR680_013830 [Steinernema hermaphroditum]